ncbi:hypothetical protein FB566_2469 [Stackebrandtia endophytica]|uniref:Uncharacterized protein n=1 Tax=Stackebrandtia endophytica TaxID=1496996 RepID=A0A543AWG9_9ACTN|nr:hypothetical protein FB566_2469 [Stackebrandtia endophytica]
MEPKPVGVCLEPRLRGPRTDEHEIALDVDLGVICAVAASSTPTSPQRISQEILSRVRTAHLPTRHADGPWFYSGRRADAATNRTAPGSEATASTDWLTRVSTGVDGNGSRLVDVATGSSRHA